MRGDLAAHEVIGFVLTFLLASIVLVFTMMAFTTTRETSQLVHAAREYEFVGAQIQETVKDLTTSAQETGNATFETLIRLPRLETVSTYVELASNQVYVNSTDGRLSLNKTTFRAEVIPGLSMSGRADSLGGTVKLCYWADDAGTVGVSNDDRKYIRIQPPTIPCGSVI